MGEKQIKNKGSSVAIAPHRDIKIKMHQPRDQFEFAAENVLLFLTNGSLLGRNDTRFQLGS